MYEYKDDNKTVIGIIVLGFVILTTWLCHDYARNRPIYQDTDNGVERLEKRLDDIGQRIDSLQERVAENKKAVERITTTVVAGRENAEVIAGGISEAERRLDSAIQASGRIKNRIEEFERKNK